MSDALSEKTTSPPAIALLRYMEWWSEEHWAAGWLSGLEHTMARDDSEVFPWLVAQAGGWWTYRIEDVEFVEGTWTELQEQAKQ